MVKDVNGQILRDGVEVRRKWAEYFEQVLNVADTSSPECAIGEEQCGFRQGRGYTESIETKESRRKLNEKKTIAHDDVTLRATARKILKKIIDLATGI